MTPRERALAFADSWVGVQETPGNRGKMVDQFNRECGVALGSPWCGSFCHSCWLHAGYHGQFKNPMPYRISASASGLYRWAKKAGRLTDSPEPGDIGLVPGGATGHRHVLMVERVEGGTVHTIEGNSNDEGSAEGHEVCRLERAKGSLRYVHLGPFVAAVPAKP